MVAIDTTIHRDAEGQVMLTTEQAEAWARYVAVPATAAGTQQRNAMLPFVTALSRSFEADGWDFPELGIESALARWVLLNAPVVLAAQQAEYDYGHRGAGAGWWGIMAAVRAARGEGEATS